ncbi:restriction endonuclease subunit S [Bacteroides sp.]|uniref:restriction endonuclease subunit S n=1 Tax=Bacteroides sp. TaxID=29523 RepID=UPI00258B2257|nr:restriction endonuclease subunit S [Bacteroides sp.]
MANNNNKNKCNVPHLRFPEFSGEWKKCTIGELAIKVGSGVTPRGGESVYKTDGHPFVRSQNVGLGHLILDDIAFIDEETHLRQKSTELKLEDVLLNITGASIGRSALVNEQAVGGNVNQHVCIIRTKENLISSFLCNFLLSNYGQRQIDSFQAGGNRQGLNFEQIKSIKIAIPSTKEQTKVAKLLQLIEERIATQNKIIEKLETLIKGIYSVVFQGTFSKECYRLGEISNLYQPSTISSANLNDDGKYLVYGANGTIGRYDKYNHEQPQITITCRGNTCGTVNYTSDFCWITGNSMVVNIEKYITIVNQRYLFHYLNNMDFSSIISGSGQPQIVRTPLEKLKIYLPSFTEQQKISANIDTIITKLSLEQSVLGYFQQQKSFLLQQMFI